MKKSVFSGIMAAIMGLSLVGCHEQETENSTSNASPETQKDSIASTETESQAETLTPETEKTAQASSADEIPVAAPSESNLSSEAVSEQQTESAVTDETISETQFSTVYYEDDVKVFIDDNEE